MVGLHQHQSLEHPHTTAARTFQANRDQVPGRNQCAHCDNEFLCLAALKHHIDGGHCHAQPDDPRLVWHHPVIVTGLYGGTFDRLTGYKSLLKRLGHICGLCGHQPTSSTTLLRHISSTHGRQCDSITSYAEWLQTTSALRNVGCTCLRPPHQPHVCTVFSQLALFVHYDLTKFRDASAGTVLAHALRMDLQVLSPTLQLNLLLLQDKELCTALSSWRSLCGRQIESLELSCKTLQPGCPVLLQVADEENQTALQKTAVHHVEWQEGPGQRKRKKRAGEDAEHQGRIHTRFRPCPSSSYVTKTVYRIHFKHRAFQEAVLATENPDLLTSLRPW